MELRAGEVAAPHHRRNRAAVIGGGDGLRAKIAGEAVREIDIVSVGEADAVVGDREAAPAHVRDRAAGRGLEAADAAGEDAEALGVLLFAALEKQLHAEA